MAAINILVNAYEVKASTVCLQCKNCVILTDGTLYKYRYLYIIIIIIIMLVYYAMTNRNGCVASLA